LNPGNGVERSMPSSLTTKGNLLLLVLGAIVVVGERARSALAVCRAVSASICEIGEIRVSIVEPVPAPVDRLRAPVNLLT